MTESSQHVPTPFLASIRRRFFGTSSSKTEKKQQQREEIEGTQTTTSNENVNEVWKSRWDEAPDDWKKFVATLDKVYGLSSEEEDRIVKKNKNYIETPAVTERSHIATSIIMITCGTVSKLLLRTLNTLHPYNINIFHQAIDTRPKGKGLLTFSNHQSVMDDPFLLGSIVPSRLLINAKKMRWGLCSMDICFQNNFLSRLLLLGKGLPIRRFGGVSQNFLRTGAEKLVGGDWLHVFCEGRVRQIGMGYFKRGVGKILAITKEETGDLPMILPLYHEGIEQVMPQKVGSNELQSLLPQRGKSLYVVVGDPVDVSHIFDRMMPDCQAAGGTNVDAQPCIQMYEEVADFLGIIMRLLRASARQKVKEDRDVDLGEPYEFS